MDIPEDLAPYAEQPINPATGVAGATAIYYSQDCVYKGGKMVGISSGRMYSPYYRKVISLCTMDSSAIVEGDEVDILWGNPGTKQKHLKAKIAPFPYVQDGRNELMDVASIPSGVPTK